MSWRRPKVAWILGSGFSKSLGGPLLDDLLTKRALEETTQVFPNLPERSAIYSLYDYWGKRLPSPYWRDAEEFLDFVDSAVSRTSRRHAVLRRVAEQFRSSNFNCEPATIRSLAALSIAAECSAFVHAFDPNSEAWEPYYQWRNLVFPGDAIITFNYDRVVELVGGDDIFGEHSVQLPTGRPIGKKWVPIYKLHGSVDWFFKDGPRTRKGSLQRNPDLVEMVARGYTPLIASPGNTKKLYTTQRLAKIWELALAHIKAAEVLVFIGYRFPPSDSQARGRLLHAIRDNENPHLRIHTVLGPNTGQPDTVRLVAMLQHVTRFRPKDQTLGKDGTLEMVTHPLYAQDFFTIVDEIELYGITSFAYHRKP